MSTSAVVVATPFYVLMDHNQRIGPNLAPLDSGIECSAIFGFSDKIPYDDFCRESQCELQPYPLVKGYLRNQVCRPQLDGTQDTCLQLVVLDAAGPRQPRLYAATAEAVLEAQENQTVHVTATHQLTFEQETSVYRVQDVSDGLQSHL